jgi:hypothetical protein
MLPSLPNGPEFKIVCFALGKPKLPNLLDGFAGTDWRVYTLADVNRDFGLAVLGVSLAMKCFMIAFAVEDIDETPCLFGRELFK